MSLTGKTTSFPHHPVETVNFPHQPGDPMLKSCTFDFDTWSNIWFCLVAASITNTTTIYIHFGREWPLIRSYFVDHKKAISKALREPLDLNIKIYASNKGTRGSLLNKMWTEVLPACLDELMHPSMPGFKYPHSQPGVMRTNPLGLVLHGRFIKYLRV